MFSIFDPSGLLSLPLNWLRRILVLVFFWRNYWTLKNKLLLSIKLGVNRLYAEFNAVFGRLAFPGSVILRIVLFLNILLNNFCGLFPYIFTSSSHGVFTLSLALPLWVGHIFIAFSQNLEVSLAHFVPLSTPRVLMPFIVLIEFIRRIIRPFTLAIRLAANIIAGHLLLRLLREKIVLGNLIIFAAVLCCLLALLLLELAVRIIQAYVFRLLSRLYLNEVNTKRLDDLK